MKVKEKNKAMPLILLCWLVYTCSYIGKLSYNANINQIGTLFDVSYSQTGMVSTFFFFVYGIGQVVNGIFCKKYNTKLVIFISLITASLMNLLVVNVTDFRLIKYIWLINGAAMSFLWTSLIRLLSETLDKKDVNKAIMMMGTTVATGTFLVYGLSALFVAVANFKITFYVASSVMMVVAFIWMFSFNSLVNPLKEERKKEVELVEQSISSNQKNGKIGLLFVILAIFAVANNFTKDGLTSWTPDIMASLYDTPGWLSILLTLLLPVLAIGGTAVAVNLHKIVKDFVGLCTILYCVSLVLLIIVIAFISTSLLPITISSFALIACLMAGVNNIITSMIPLNMKDKFNSGKLAGILNGFCYLGSTLSSYGLGLIADHFGWVSVFTTLLIVMIVVVLIGISYLIIQKFKKETHKDML